ncbi:LMBR1-like membrane protein-domain-containing protein [Plectosphaerella plurivora]|uniref:Probable lysosomal cobalamin transporter n=1 Tax=Plectosphaerella plurivora TaxID=936078 RepID=A0A9P8VK43_9PEZI|nr:LMBR1-like membrane protein-domain-containing protein [Plectosphaerella plurivora]
MDMDTDMDIMANAGLVQTSLIWVAYAVAVGFCLVAAIITTFTWQAPRERSAIVSVVSIVSLTALLATVLLLPVDIALVSSTTSASLGVKKDWATEKRVHNILQTLRIVYYSLYSFDALLCLLIIPFSYFWFEEYDEIEVEEGRSFTSRLLSALRYTAIFVALVLILFLVGFFVPAAGDDTRAHWDFDYLKNILAANKGQKALSFVLGLLVTLGVLLYVVYTAAGLALLPMSFIKSAPAISAPALSESTASALEQNQERQRQLEMRNAGRPEGMSSKDRRELDALTREERTLRRRERIAAEASGEGRSGVYQAWLKVCAVFRPIKLLGGILLLFLSVIIWVSMLITGIDKAKNSICKEKCGYILGRIHIFQPVNWLFLQTARAFPVDYVLMALLVLFLFASSVSGLAAVGIRFLWVRIFQIRRGRTAPQALLIATVMLALVILAINYSLVAMIAPQYATYGTQTWCSAPHAVDQKPDCRERPEYLLTCAETLEKEAYSVCTPSVMSDFLNRVAITWPFFGVVDFWAQFGFLLVFLIVFITGLFRTPKLNLSQIDSDAEEDEEEGLLASTGRRFGATWQDITGRTRRNDYGTAGDESTA